VKLKHLGRCSARRREIVRLYQRLLAGARLTVPRDDPRGESVYHLFVVYVENRDAVRAALEKRGVQTAIHYPRPVHLQKAYAWLGHRPGSFPITEHACDRVLSLPLFPEMTNEQAEYVARMLVEVVGKAGS
jgi:dTDP-4-amino-4,6-dideoxygalactose transaminase